MQARFKMVDTNVLNAQGQPTGMWRYRVVDGMDDTAPSQQHVYENREEALNVCTRLNSEQLN